MHEIPSPLPKRPLCRRLTRPAAGRRRPLSSRKRSDTCSTNQHLFALTFDPDVRPYRVRAVRNVFLVAVVGAVVFGHFGARTTTVYRLRLPRAFSQFGGVRHGTSRREEKKLSPRRAYRCRARLRELGTRRRPCGRAGWREKKNLRTITPSTTATGGAPDGFDAGKNKNREPNGRRC